MDSSIFEFGTFHSSQKGCFTKHTGRVANSIDPDEMARYEPSYLDLCCLQISVKASLGMNELILETSHYYYTLVYIFLFSMRPIDFGVSTVRRSCVKVSGFIHP